MLDGVDGLAPEAGPSSGALPRTRQERATWPTVELFVSVISPELGLLKLSPGQRRPGLKAGVFQ
jgi:hypothetical protein